MLETLQNSVEVALNIRTPSAFYYATLNRYKCSKYYGSVDFLYTSSTSLTIGQQYDFNMKVGHCRWYYVVMKCGGAITADTSPKTIGMFEY